MFYAQNDITVSIKILNFYNNDIVYLCWYWSFSETSTIQSLQSLNNLNNVGYDKQAKHIEVLCSIDVNVTYQNQKKQLILLVISGDGPSLLGQDWL